MTTIVRGLAVGVVLAGCAIGLASPASAELTDGLYDLTFVGDSTHKPMVVDPCGVDCKHLQILGNNPVDFHLQGNTWTGLTSDGTTVTIDNDTLGGSSGSDPFTLTKTG